MRSADDRREHLGCRAGKDSEAQCAKPDADVVTGEPVIHFKGQHRSASKTVALNRGDHRDRKLPQRTHHAVPLDEERDL
jgi:hypothetical protein